MARVDTLSNYLTDVGNAIKQKRNISDKLIAKNYDDEIKKISTGININGEEKEYLVSGEKVSIGDFVQVSKIPEPNITSYEGNIGTYRTKEMKTYRYNNYYIFCSPTGNLSFFNFENNILVFVKTIHFTNSYEDIIQLQENTFIYVTTTNIGFLEINEQLEIKNNNSLKLDFNSNYSSLRETLLKLDNTHFVLIHGTWNWPSDYHCSMYIGKVENNNIVFGTPIGMTSNDFYKCPMVYDNTTNMLYTFLNDYGSSPVNLDKAHCYKIDLEKLQATHQKSYYDLGELEYNIATYAGFSMDKKSIIILLVDAYDNIYLSVVPIDTCKASFILKIADETTFDESLGSVTAYINNNKILVDWANDNDLARHDVGIFLFQAENFITQTTFSVPSQKGREGYCSGCYFDISNTFITTSKEKDSSATAEVINLINIPYEIEKYKGGTILGVSLTNTEINNKATVIVPIA